MIRINKICEELKRLIGWEQAYAPSDFIHSELTESESGLYFQQAHPLLTLNNIKAVMPDDYIYKFPKWNTETEYVKGARVSHGGIVWIANYANTGEEPPAAEFSGDYSQDFGGAWSAYNLLSDYLERLARNGITKTVQNFLQMKKLQNETKNVLEHRTFFDGAGRINNTIQNKNKLVGYEIQPVRSMGVTTKIEKIGLQFRGTGVVHLYLYHSSLEEPVKEFELAYDKNGGYQWFSLEDCYLPYIGENNAGGSWYLCYDQSELPIDMEAINISKDWSREPCGTCNVGSLETWREITKYLIISPFAYAGERDGGMWDIERNTYTNTMCYGMNCEISVGCDLTDFIISQRNIFATLIQKQVAFDALREMAMNPNVQVSRNQLNVQKNEILYELDGNTEGRAGGLGYELKREYEAAGIDTSGLDRVCLACNNKGVHYRAV